MRFGSSDIQSPLIFVQVPKFCTHYLHGLLLFYLYLVFVSPEEPSVDDPPPQNPRLSEQRLDFRLSNGGLGDRLSAQSREGPDVHTSFALAETNSCHDRVSDLRLLCHRVR